MKVCIVGAGAIGGFIGTRLAMNGHDVSAFARGDTLKALRKHGWRLRQGGQLRGGPARASDSSAELGAHDLVVVAVKGQSLPGVAPHVKPLLLRPVVEMKFDAVSESGGANAREECRALARPRAVVHRERRAGRCEPLRHANDRRHPDFSRQQQACSSLRGELEEIFGLAHLKDASLADRFMHGFRAAAR